MKRIVAAPWRVGFSLIELLISLIVISIIITAFAPIITKRVKNSQLSLSSSGEITTECDALGEKCELCTKKHCIKCGLESCEIGKYINNKKCDCSNCGDWDANCTQCNSKGCTKCSSSSYYVKDGKCEPCPTNHYCDGVNDYATCPGEGYYCDTTGIHKCSDMYHSACTTCDASTCLSCANHYYRTAKGCSSCNMDTCAKCTSTSVCTKCDSNYILDAKTHKCEVTCGSKITGCYTCTDASTCTSCKGGYYLNTNHTCTKCTISNCQKCIDERTAASPACESCKAGYFLSNGACYTCSSKFGADCVACDTDKCISCAQGATIKTAAANPACVSIDKKFGCSDSNFMQIGELCVTRKNMGDSYALSIPSTVIIAQAPGEYCYSTNQKCCWKGETSKTGCDTENGGYSGCNRTVCNWSAAKEICEKFNYQGKTWRLPTNEEMKLWYSSSVGMSADGLMLCDASAGYSSAKCAFVTNCLGSYSGRCSPRYVWSGQAVNSLVVYSFNLASGVWYGPNLGSVFYAFSVRCVSDM